MTDEERIQQLENELEVTILFGEEADRKYEEVCPTAGSLCCPPFRRPQYAVHCSVCLFVCLVKACSSTTKGHK